MPTSKARPGVLENDLYQLTMAYAYWKAGRHEEEAVFDYFFRKCPFGGEFAVFAGLADLLDYVLHFAFTRDDVEYLKAGPLANAEPEFFSWLLGVNFSRMKIYAMREGTVVFPRTPVVRVEGPLAIVQMLETPLLAALNYPSLMTTNAVRYRLAAGEDKLLLEFGLRRAQDGMRASHYAWLGGFDGTSNVEAARLLGIPPRGTMAHSYVSSFSGLEDLKELKLADCGSGEIWDFAGEVLRVRGRLGYAETNDGELAAFINYAMAFPHAFLALVDTYDTLKSGVPNFLSVAATLVKFGYKPLGIRIDSGDLAYLSQEARKLFRRANEIYFGQSAVLSRLAIGASNDINEETLWALRAEGHEINVFGIGTHLVTCEGQPAFGGVYKLVALNGKSKIKLSNDADKVTIPGRKEVYRLIRADGKAFLDLMLEAGETPPAVGEPIICRDPFHETKRVRMIPSGVVPLHELVWDGRLVQSLPPRADVRGRVKSSLALTRDDHLRRLNPTPYKVSVSEGLYGYMHELWLQEAPIAVVQ
ncbi:MAG: hypothetical protein UY71_C0002G0013 [Parcubacteria group bacterium GW2011_GWB1_52_7]|nr:MAG: hypothetical protein UY64_C0003G0015 [Parcubacteria group bacterium GW2011_GWA1_51_12]KKW29168.1 MAG: hypothetical protein UY71_C0002G0013 [Parcubacteria group bacterium GW2011_GWB1_52_7]